MANPVRHTLLMRNGNGTQKDLLEDFGFVCLEGETFPTATKMKELEKLSWADEDGDDVYIPNRLRCEGEDLSIPIGIDATKRSVSARSDVHGKLETLRDFLVGKTEPLNKEGMRVYLMKYEIGYKGCYLKEIADIEYNQQGKYEILTCTLVFGVLNPLNRTTRTGNGLM